jgi:hypothetical protein
MKNMVIKVVVKMQAEEKGKLEVRPMILIKGNRLIEQSKVTS